jgi:hypothetical protein
MGESSADEVVVKKQYAVYGDGYLNEIRFYDDARKIVAKSPSTRQLRTRTVTIIKTPWEDVDDE